MSVAIRSCPTKINIGGIMTPLFSVRHGIGCIPVLFRLYSLSQTIFELQQVWYTFTFLNHRERRGGRVLLSAGTWFVAMHPVGRRRSNMAREHALFNWTGNDTEIVLTLHQRLSTTRKGAFPSVSLRGRLIVVAHEFHTGIVRTEQRLSMRVLWPEMNVEVDAYTKDLHLSY